jgi:hypothetical protein
MDNIRKDIYNKCKMHCCGNYPEELKNEIVNKILDNNLTINQFYDLMEHIIESIEDNAHINP